MVSQSLIDIREVNAFGEYVPDPSTADSGSLQSRQPLDMPLPQLRSQKGNFLIPAYLPDSFSLSRSVSGGDAEISLGYTKDDGRVNIRALQGTDPFLVSVKAGSVQATSIDGTSAYLIRGGWVQHVHKDGREGQIFWSSDSAVSIVFQQDDRWVMIRAAPFPINNGLTDADLIRVAGSMNKYDAVMT